MSACAVQVHRVEAKTRVVIKVDTDPLFLKWFWMCAVISCARMVRVRLFLFRVASV